MQDQIKQQRETLRALTNQFNAIDLDEVDRRAVTIQTDHVVERLNRGQDTLKRMGLLVTEIEALRTTLYTYDVTLLNDTSSLFGREPLDDDPLMSARRKMHERLSALLSEYVESVETVRGVIRFVQQATFGQLAAPVHRETPVKEAAEQKSNGDSDADVRERVRAWVREDLMMAQESVENNTVR